MLAWHFLAEPDRLSDGKPLVVGQKQAIEGELKIHKNAFHASISPLDALSRAVDAVKIKYTKYDIARGTAKGASYDAVYVGRVKCGGQVIVKRDEVACSERTHLWICDVTRTLYEFARVCAQDVSGEWFRELVVDDKIVEIAQHLSTPFGRLPVKLVVPQLNRLRGLVQDHVLHEDKMITWPNGFKKKVHEPRKLGAVATSAVESLMSSLDANPFRAAANAAHYAAIVRATRSVEDDRMLRAVDEDMKAAKARIRGEQDMVLENMLLELGELPFSSPAWET